MTKIANVEVDHVFDGYVLLKNVTCKTDKNGKAYLDITFQDTSGVMDGKLWNISDRDIEQYKQGIVVYLKAIRELYKGRTQLRIMKMRPLTENEYYTPADFIKSAPLSVENMKTQIERYIDKIEQQEWHKVVQLLYQKYQDCFLTYPAAKKYHHAYYGGLAYHTLTMLYVAESLCQIYPILNASLLYSGVILHDLGKVVELTGVNSTEYTLEGNLIGHLVLMDEEIIEICIKNQIDHKSEDMILLRHMVLSHHGELEYGSPVKPRIIEAEVLHQIDYLDATMQMMTSALERTGSENYSERIPGLDNRMFYQTKK